MSPEAARGLAAFIRHGHSEWNLAGRFTGWTDIDLTGIGLAESAAAGRRLVAAGLQFDAAFVSALRRTRQSLDALVAAAGWSGLPVHEDWRLNERHYGALQGMVKQDIFAAWGEERSRRWWRGYREPPPALRDDDARHPRHDPRYRDVDPALLPATESLRDCQSRVLSCWRELIAPRLATGERLLIVSHGNTLRGLVMYLDGISAEDMEHVEIPPGVPLIYHFAPDLTVTGRQWLA